MTIVQKMREKAKLSQIELSRRSGVKQSVISDIFQKMEAAKRTIQECVYELNQLCSIHIQNEDTVSGN